MLELEHVNWVRIKANPNNNLSGVLYCWFCTSFKHSQLPGILYKGEIISSHAINIKTGNKSNNHERWNEVFLLSKTNKFSIINYKASALFFLDILIRVLEMTRLLQFQSWKENLIKVTSFPYPLVDPLKGFPRITPATIKSMSCWKNYKNASWAARVAI